MISFTSSVDRETNFQLHIGKYMLMLSTLVLFLFIFPSLESYSVSVPIPELLGRSLKVTKFIEPASMLVGYEPEIVQSGIYNPEADVQVPTENRDVKVASPSGQWPRIGRSPDRQIFDNDHYRRMLSGAGPREPPEKPGRPPAAGDDARAPDVTAQERT